MAIEPDNKNWTWVIERACPDCGFDPATVEFEDVPRLVRENADQWRPLLERPGATRRPRDDVWSTLEYGAHVRDVFDIFRGRVEAILAVDGTQFDNWDQDATAVEEKYGEQDPSTVADQLTAAGDAVADTFAAVPDDARGRRGLRSDGSAFTLDTLAVYFLHDPIHHLHDVTNEGSRP